MPDACETIRGTLLLCALINRVQLTFGSCFYRGFREILSTPESEHTRSFLLSRKIDGENIGWCGD